MAVHRMYEFVVNFLGLCMSYKNLNCILLLPVLFFLFSCSAPKPTQVVPPPQPPQPSIAVKSPTPIYIVAKQHKKLRSPDSKTIHLLYSQYREWRGTPYRMGGLSKKGIDCSGFVYLTYRSLADIKLPRTTRQQVNLGQAVALQNLRAGDLLFFKTGWATRHVGIYIQDGKFLHASTNRGVIISRLSEKYWRDAFWVAKRL